MREAQLAEHLARIDHDMRALEHDRRLAAREREALETAEARMRQRDEALKQREEASRTRLSEELDSQVREARKQIDGVIAKLKQKTQALADEAARRTSTPARVARPHRSTGGGGRGRRARSSSRAGASVDGRTATALRPGVGARAVGMLGLEGVVTSMHDGTAEVDVRGKRMRAHVRDLRVIGRRSGAARPE